MRSHVRGRLFSTGRRFWAYEVSLDGTVVLTDNSSDWASLYAACRRDVEAVARVSSGGHHFHAWEDIMDDSQVPPIGNPEGLTWYSPAHSPVTGSGKYGWYLAGKSVTDREAALLVQAGADVQRAVAHLRTAEEPVGALIAAVVAAHH